MILKDRVALVTGASRGIGAATARLLAAEGAAVGVNYVNNSDAAREVVGQIAEAGGQAVPVQADVTRPDQVDRMVGEVREAFGEIDAVVLNAGLSFPVKPFLEFEWEEFEPKLVGEIKSAFQICKAVVPSMIERGQGSIVVISSTLSRQAGEGFIPHCTTKSGLDAFVRSVALELGPHGVRVNTIAPGLTDTDATAFIPAEAKKAMGEALPMRRIGDPDDVAGAVLMMLSDYAGYVTGSYTPVAGGGLML